MKRILIADSVREVGKEVTLMGWVATRRDHGKVMFIDLRDRSGFIQCVGVNLKENITTEDVVKIAGLVKERPVKMVNPKIATGKVEVEIKSLEIVSKAKELPIPIDGDGYDVNEESRLKYRYLDLRRDRLTKNIRLRSQFVQKVREFLFSKDFCEIETPLLTKSTPEGSRDFVVPSRLQQGNFYALPQSPQQYKQLLMGFIEREDVMEILEEMITQVFESFDVKIKQKPFPVLTYKEAMEKFASDKFDLRNEEEKKNGVKAFAWVVDFPFFEKDKEGKWTFTHNPFSKPKDEFIKDLLNKRNIEGILTTQYDLVCNGFEVGGGSTRAHRPEILEAVFGILGYEKKEIWEKFGHMLEAFSYGAPPHGGCAFGVERLIMMLANEQYLREVVAFPQTSGGRTSVMDAPNQLSSEQLKELGIKVIKNR